MNGCLQIKNGKYYAVLYRYENNKRKPQWIYTGYATKGNKKRAEQFLRNKLVEAEAEEAALEEVRQKEELKGQPWEPDKDALFTDYIQIWLERAKNRVDEVTYHGYCQITEKHIVPYFSELGIKVVDVDKNVIQHFINEKHKNGRLDGKGGLSYKTTKHFKTTISGILKEAIKDRVISYNPCEFVDLPKKTSREITYYNENQLNDLFEKTRDHYLYPVIKTTLLYGLRRSEVLALQWDSVDFEKNTITIKYSVAGVTSFVYKNSTKSDSSYRTNPLLDEVKEFILEAKKTEKTYRELLGNCYIENDFIFKWPDGKPYNPNCVSRTFSILLKNENLPYIRFHDLRHSCASYFVANGWTMKDIQEWLGHADISTTAHIYAHLDMQRKTEMAKAIATI